MRLPPLSLYIHTPWCIKKCPYCDFNSHQLRGDLPESEYTQALINNIDTLLPYINGRELQSIFIGGGTPSLISGKAYARLFSEIKKRIPFSQAIEITLEANPGTVDAQYFKAYRETGINRLSIGVQSFQNDKLKKLGRIHQRDEVYRAVEIARAAGFNNMNIDLMFGLPGQTVEDALFDLKSAFNLSPTHLSWYQLTLEPQTSFYKHPPALPEDELIWDMQEAGQALLQQNGFTQYEVSAYAKKNRVCKHNLNYWEFGDYLGIGAGAHSKLTDTEKQCIYRIEQIKSPKFYIANPDQHRTFNTISKKALAFEFMLNALRLQKPTSIQLFKERTGCTLEMIQAPLERANALGLLSRDTEYFHVSEKGRLYLNNLLELFLDCGEETKAGSQ